jgi:hypothetical protein
MSKTVPGIFQTIFIMFMMLLEGTISAISEAFLTENPVQMAFYIYEYVLLIMYPILGAF